MTKSFTEFWNLRSGRKLRGHLFQPFGFRDGKTEEWTYISLHNSFRGIYVSFAFFVSSFLAFLKVLFSLILLALVEVFNKIKPFLCITVTQVGAEKFTENS